MLNLCCTFRTKRLAVFMLPAFVMIITVKGAHAAPQTSPVHTLHFSVTEQARVSNDSVAITFAHLAQAPTAEAVMAQINQKMQQAQNELRPFTEIEIQTSHYQVHPFYDKSQMITHWQGQQNLTIQTENQAGLPKLLAQLQPLLMYQSLRFYVSNRAQAQASKDLLSKALKHYQAKAQRIANTLGAQSYRLLETHITSNQPAVPYRTTALRSTRLNDESHSEPLLEAGKTEMSVHISGTMVITD